MKVLVAYASRHGATRGIAERVAQTLERDGLEVTLERVDRAREVEGYDAFVIGASAYFFHWAKEATGFVRRHGSLLSTHPTWLFSSGPLGTEKVDANGRDAYESARPREFPELDEAIHPREERIFFGAYDPNASPVGFMERLTRLMPATRNALPSGDFRDWPEIEAWADGIARALDASAARPA